MKIPVELTNNIKYAIGLDIAKACALSWFEAAFDEVPKIPKETVETLYQYAFVDGMNYLYDVLNQNKLLVENESRS